MDPDDSDADAAALRARVDALEQTVSEQQATIDELSDPPVSRRGVLAALTGVAGAGALGAYSQRASAQAAGQVGTQSEPVDVEAWSLTVQDQLAGDLDAGGNDLTNVGVAEVDELNIGNTLWTARNDDELGTVLSNASNGDTILLLLDSNLSVDRTISKRLTIIGGASHDSALYQVTANWTLDARITLVRVSFTNPSITISADKVQLQQCGGYTGCSVSANDNEIAVLDCYGFDVTFDSGTSSGIVDGCRLTSVTDNGTNTVGDIA